MSNHIPFFKEITLKETIAAIATGMSNSGIGIIRMSGSESISIIDKIFVPIKGRKIADSKSHTIHYGHIKYDDEVLDEVLVMVMKAPNSYTKEDVIEINCHGGIFVMKKIMEVLIKSGARTAEPGEFTKRAFLNGRIDLSQAEAVIDIINSKNRYALDNSVRLLNGELSEKIVEMRTDLINKVAYIESALDDPDNFSLDNFGDNLLETVDNYENTVDNLLKSVDNGKIFTQGVNTVIIGKPNAGKSSILNILSGYDRAIVTDIEGTTRDTIEEQINLNGITLNLVDTAGIRDTKDVIEEIGVEKAKKLACNADLVLYVVDSSTPLDDNDYKILNIVKDKKTIVILNKSDLETRVNREDIREIIDTDIVLVSALNREGIDILSDIIVELFINHEIDFNDEVYISDERNIEALLEVKQSLSNLRESINLGVSEDFYTVDMMNAYESLGKIIGEALEDDLVNEIFSKFCMGI